MPNYEHYSLERKAYLNYEYETNTNLMYKKTEAT